MGKKNAKNTVVDAVETPEVIEASDETVLDAQGDITASAEGMAVCTACKVEKPQTEENFSPNAKKGGFHQICKPCRTAATNAWTEQRKDYRTAYQRAVQFVNLGIPVYMPNAKDWKAGDPLMTIEYATLNGETVALDTEGATIFPSRNAEDVYAELREARKEKREARKAEKERLAKEEKDEAARKRQEARDEKARKAEQDKAEARRKREEARNEKAAKKAEDARLAREKADAEREEARNAKILKAAEEARLERERKEAERKQAILDKALGASA